MADLDVGIGLPIGIAVSFFKLAELARLSLSAEPTSPSIAVRIATSPHHPCALGKVEWESYRRI